MHLRKFENPYVIRRQFHLEFSFAVVFVRSPERKNAALHPLEPKFRRAVVIGGTGDKIVGRHQFWRRERIVDRIARGVRPARKIDNHIHVERIDFGWIDRRDSHRHLDVIDILSWIVGPYIP